MDFSGAGTGRGTIVPSSAAIFLVERFNASMASTAAVREGRT
jgi:hypothetical protein